MTSKVFQHEPELEAICTNNNIVSHLESVSGHIEDSMQLIKRKEVNSKIQDVNIVHYGW